VVGLVGDLVVIVVPRERHNLEKALGVLFTFLVLAGVYVEHVGDDAISARFEARATIAESALAKLKAPRTLTPERQQAIATAAAPFAGQRFRAAISQGADDGVAFWESLYAPLKQAGWIYLPATLGMGNPAAGIPIAAIPGVEIRFDPSKRAEMTPPALALGNALHADATVVAVNTERQSYPNEDDRNILLIVIGARVPPP